MVGKTNCLVGALTNYHIHRCKRCKTEFACTEHPKKDCRKKWCQICLDKARGGE